MDYICVKRHDERDEGDSEYSVVFYKEPAEVALMWFFALLQKETELEGLSEETREKMLRMAQKFQNDDCMDGMFCAALYFLSSVDDSVVSEFSALGNGKIGMPESDGDGIPFDEFVEKYRFALKAISVHDNIAGIPDYCTIKIPAAYLMRSSVDAVGYYKAWLSDTVLDKVFEELSCVDVVNYMVFSDALTDLARKNNVTLAELDMMIEGYLVNELVKYYVENGGVSLEYREIINHLIERLCKDYGA